MNSTTSCMTPVFLPWIVALALLLFAAAPSAQVYRCGNAYSSKPCAGGQPVDTSPTMSLGGAAAGTATLYLCQSYGGGLFWTREHCAQRNALVERMESVPADMPFERQVELARGQRERSQAMAVTAPSGLRLPRPRPC